jgi:hypothetical protein
MRVDARARGHGRWPRLAALVVALAVAAGCAGAPRPQAQALTPAAWLAEHSERVDLAEPRLALLDDELADHRVFLAGEVHGVAANADLAFALLRHLHERADVRVVLAELPYAVGEVIDGFLRTGDDDLLVRAHRDAGGSAFGTPDQLDLWRRIRDWNASLPTGARITVEGLDAELVPSAAFAFLDDLSSRRSRPPALAEVLDRLPALADASAPSSRRFTPEAASMVRDLRALVDGQRAALEGLLGPDHPRFVRTVEGLERGTRLSALLRAGRTAELTGEREAGLRAAAAAFFEASPDARAFGQWGLEHVLLRPRRAAGFGDDEPRLAQWLHEEVAAVRGRVLSIVYVYRDSQRRVEGAEGRVEPVEPVPDPQVLAGIEGPFTLLRLAGDGTPFASADPLLGGTDTGTAAYAPVALLVDGSPASPAARR